MSPKYAIYVLLIIACILNSVTTKAKRSFTIDYKNNCFLKDGEPFRYISGSLHYFRVPHAFWRDRMMKMKAAGLNALQTYIEWSHHEPEPGTYNFKGDYDLITFLQVASDVGLLIVLRPGPYIDAEREFGGFPYWLLREKVDMKLRTSDQDYLHYVDQWLAVLLPMLTPFLYANGGPIISIQVENEYGSYDACDFAYTTHLRDLYRQYFDNDVVLFTTDGNNEPGLTCGKVDGVLAGVDFGSGTNVTESFHHQRLHQSAGPLLNSEYYPGWLDHWGEPHQTRSTDDVCKTLDDILAVNASVNIYMFHGGTSFGFSNGANLGNTYQPCPTSYDYDAPLSEAGDPTPKYFAMRETIGKYLPLPPGPVPPANPKMALGKYEMNMYSTLWNVVQLSKQVTSTYPLSFEELSHAYGFVFYTTTISFIAHDPAILKVPGLCDRGYVFVDHVFLGILDRSQDIYSLPVMIQPNQNISILVENQGRIAFGSGIYDRKGIIQNVTLDSSVLTNWTMYPITLHGKDLYKYFMSPTVEDAIDYTPHTPSFYLSIFRLPSTPGYPYDTFLKLDGWHKGVAFLNWHNLGRYWPIVGPQVTLYVPSVYFQPYEEWNVVAVFELEHAPCDSSSQCVVEFVDTPIIDGPTPD